MSKIILIKKYDSSHRFWSNLVRKKRLEKFSVERIVSQFQGFEGDLICSFFSTKINITNFIKKYVKIAKSDNYLLLYIISNKEIINNEVKNLFLKVGYDFGVCEKDKTLYSSIFNEILFGNIEKLITYKDVLNQNLLFPNKSSVENYVFIHHELLIKGKDVEGEDDMKIYEIWKYKN